MEGKTYRSYRIISSLESPSFRINSDLTPRSKPVMDLLVTLCASYHLNPSDYTVEVVSPNKNNISFKPNSPIGSLEAERIVLKPRGAEEKIRTPYMPEVRTEPRNGRFSHFTVS